MAPRGQGHSLRVPPGPGAAVPTPADPNSGDSSWAAGNKGQWQRLNSRGRGSWTRIHMSKGTEPPPSSHPISRGCLQNRAREVPSAVQLSLLPSGRRVSKSWGRSRQERLAVNAHSQLWPPWAQPSLPGLGLFICNSTELIQARCPLRPSAAGCTTPKVSAKSLTVLQFSTPSTGQLQTCTQRGHFYSSSWNWNKCPQCSPL